MRYGEGVSLSPQGKGLGKGQCLLPGKFFGILGSNGVFSWTLVAKFRFFSMIKTVYSLQLVVRVVDDKLI